MFKVETGLNGNLPVLEHSFSQEQTENCRKFLANGIF